jgi:hypothetical protein
MQIGISIFKYFFFFFFFFSLVRSTSVQTNKKPTQNSNYKAKNLFIDSPTEKKKSIAQPERGSMSTKKKKKKTECWNDRTNFHNNISKLGRHPNLSKIEKK